MEGVRLGSPENPSPYYRTRGRKARRTVAPVHRPVTVVDLGGRWSNPRPANCPAAPAKLAGTPLNYSATREINCVDYHSETPNIISELEG